MSQKEHDKLRKNHIKAMSTGSGLHWYRCTLCYRQWVGEPELHALGCPARPKVGGLTIAPIML